MKKKIIDVSCFNTVTDWNAVAREVDGVVIRIGYRGYSAGNIKIDASFHKHIQGALNAGIPVSFYFMSQAINEAEAEQEAKYCCCQLVEYSMILPDNSDIQVYYDSEYSSDKKTGRADKLTTQQRTAVCKAFCQSIELYGYRAGVYASKSWFLTHLDVTELTDYILWVAQYNKTCTADHRIDLWQYTSSGAITGISGKVDISECYITFGSGSGSTVPVDITRQSGYDCPYAEPTVILYQGRHGMAAGQVRWLQWQLVRLGYLPALNEAGQDNIDGVFGKRTAAAVYGFQSEHPETYTTDTPDCKIGPMSREVLKRL
ncbi:MAG: hypothetical protein HDR21_12210 [Lachnospiraceae bacterium]|nr:hypothetical protein [Lachnospiraceae bacterium]